MNLLDSTEIPLLLIYSTLYAFVTQKGAIVVTHFLRIAATGSAWT
jgi:hypothetical protein